MQFIGRETENTSFKDLQRFWYQTCDILLSQIRQADHFKKTSNEFPCFLPCSCDGCCDRFEKRNVIKEAVEMRVTGETMVRALSAVSTAAHKKMISEEEYLKKYSDFLENKEDILADRDESNKNNTDDDDDDFAGACIGFTVLIIVFIIAMIFLGP